MQEALLRRVEQMVSSGILSGMRRQQDEFAAAMREQQAQLVQLMRGELQEQQAQLIRCMRGELQPATAQRAPSIPLEEPRHASLSDAVQEGLRRSQSQIVETSREEIQQQQTALADGLQEGLRRSQSQIIRWVVEALREEMSQQRASLTDALQEGTRGSQSQMAGAVREAIQTQQTALVDALQEGLQRAKGGDVEAIVQAQGSLREAWQETQGQREHTAQTIDHLNTLVRDAMRLTGALESLLGSGPPPMHVGPSPQPLHPPSWWN